jgi:hypothetical protein
MTNVFFDSPMDDDRRRAALYNGDLFAFSPRPAALAMARLARELLEEAFAPHDPREAQHHLDVETYATILGRVKPAFIHHPRCKELIPQLMRELGADPENVYFDVPKMRSATAHSFLTTGIAYAFHPHRDTWYSAPPQQLNWWFPVYEIDADNGLAFHTKYFDQPIPNSSHTYNYYRWNAQRDSAVKMIGTDTRVQPEPTGPIDLDPQVRVVAPVGGVLVFSPQHLHSTVPNATSVTRFSIDFRTVHRDDVARGRGAPRVDSFCTGTALRDFVRCTDLARLPDDLIALYDDETALEFADSLVYKPSR